MRTLPALMLSALLWGCGSDIKLDEQGNVAPTAVIDSPQSGSTFTEGEAVSFLGILADSNGLDDIQTVTWSSTLDGELADPGLAVPDSDGFSRVSAVLSAGDHGITLRAVDTDGAIGENTINLSVGAESQSPTVLITDPIEFQEFFPGEVVLFDGDAQDDQQDADTLDVVWTVTDNSSGNLVEAISVTADPTGSTNTTWVPTSQGNFRVGLEATDDDGNTTLEQVLVLVNDPSLADLDGDTFSPAGGDCNDNDATVNPLADETCGDLTDHDCNGEVDDKDLDNDGHIDEYCVNYPGTLPIDDCDDLESTVYGGAYELPDGLDNDCDGEIDNGGPLYDDDGDCFCEGDGSPAGCVGSISSCPTLDVGDCDDAEPSVNPMVGDDPDQAFIDDNCDGIDGDLLNAIFVDPVGGSDSNGGLGPTDALRSLGPAQTAAAANGLDWVLIADGVLSFSFIGDNFFQGVNLAGGYDATSGWTRSAASLPTIQVPSYGKVLFGWTVPTEWQQVRVEALDAIGTGVSSVALTLDNVQGLSLVETVIAGGNGTAGGDGNDGGVGGNGSGGARGSDGCQNSSFLCNECSRPPGGSGGASATGCTTGGGGIGGVPGVGGSAGTTGNTGNGVGGGAPGGGGSSDGDPGNPGLDGSDGAEGLPGASGSQLGTFFIGGYTEADGSNGGNGSCGAGGGGAGGGAGGGWTFANCDTYGGSGGGAGGAGGGGGSGLGGNGGGGSFALLLLNSSSITITGGSIETGNGGDGGDGGEGGDGGNGGVGGNGGNGDSSIISETSGPGGQGGDGGDGGRGGHGGGGGGGPTVGIVCRTSSTITGAGPTYTNGSPGNGGGGPGSSGSTGFTADTDGC